MISSFAVVEPKAISAFTVVEADLLLLLKFLLNDGVLEDCVGILESLKRFNVRRRVHADCHVELEYGEESDS